MKPRALTRKALKLLRSPGAFFRDLSVNRHERLDPLRLPIFCFWEPRSKLPAYLKLCMETWARHFTNAQVVLMDYRNMHKYYDTSLYNADNLAKLSLPQQADAIRVAVLEQNGGLWLDCDTIVLRDPSPFLALGEHHDFITFGVPGRYSIVGVLYAPRPHSAVLRAWRESLQKKLNGAPLLERPRWDFAANSILGPWIAAKRFTDREWKILSSDEFALFPEDLNTKARGIENFQQFWFDTERRIEAALVGDKQFMIALHNSWTHDWYRRKDRTYIAGPSDELLSRVIRHALRV
jgi:hypothetical protein